MVVQNQYLIVLMIMLSLFIGNSEMAGWKFWKKDKEITSTTSVSINVQSTTVPTKATVSTNRENVRNNLPSYPRTEFGLDIDVSKSNRPGIGRGDSQSYRNLTVDLIRRNEPSQNQPSIISQGSTINNDGSTVSSIRIDQNRSNAFSSANGRTWADIVAIKPVSPTGLPTIRQPEYSMRAISGENKSTITCERSTQPVQSNQYNRPALSRDVEANIVKDATTRAIADSTRKMYSSNPTYSKGNIVTDEDLEKLSEALYIKETSNNANQYTTVNLQKQTTSSSLIDQAPQPLLTISSEAFQIPTIQRVLSIFDNYQLDTHTNEYINPSQRQEESLLIDNFLNTNTMSAAMRFLADKGFVRQDYYEYKDTLRRIWFNLLSRGQGKIGSSGFEHVFMAETKQVDSGTDVLGLHNWIYFNAEEIKRRADYLGYIKKTDLGNKGSIIKMHVKFNGHDKPVTTMFIGTSPELEMSLYTVCFYARPDASCPVSLGGTKFNIITRKFRYRGKDLVGTAYPEI